MFAEGPASHTAGDVGDGGKFRAGGRVDREPQTAFDGNWEALLGLRRRSPANNGYSVRFRPRWLGGCVGGCTAVSGCTAVNITAVRSAITAGFQRESPLWPSVPSAISGHAHGGPRGSKPRHGDSSRRGTCWTCAASSLVQLELSHFSNFARERRENIPPRLPLLGLRSPYLSSPFHHLHSAPSISSFLSFPTRGFLSPRPSDCAWDNCAVRAAAPGPRLLGTRTNPRKNPRTQPSS